MISNKLSVSCLTEETLEAYACNVSSSANLIVQFSLVEV